MSRAAQSALVVAAGVAIVAIGTGVIRLAVRDRLSRINARSILRWSAAIGVVFALLAVWHAFSGRSALVVGLVAGGLTFALQEVVGAVAGWINVLAGRVYRVGDRIEIAGVQGDVIEITPLRTKILEIGSARQLADDGNGTSTGSWIKGRQATGRVVALSNKTTFQEPVFNYSASFDFVFEEVTIPVPYGADWQEAERILLEEARRASSAQAEEALQQMAERYPIASVQAEPRVYVRATDNWVELSARFAIPVRNARETKAEMTRRIIRAFEERGLEVASATVEATVRTAGIG